MHGQNHIKFIRVIFIFSKFKLYLAFKIGLGVNIYVICAKACILSLNIFLSLTPYTRLIATLVYNAIIY